MVLLKNLVVLGQGAPNQLKDGRQSTCICSWSLDDKCFIRIYPVPLGWLRKWDMFDVEVEKNHRDYRENTWKIKNSKEDWKRLNKWIKKADKDYPKKDRINLIESIPKTTIGELRESGKSLGLIKPIIVDFKLVQKKDNTEKQMTLMGFSKSDGETTLDEGYEIINQKDYKYKPYLVYYCEIGGKKESKKNNKPYEQQITEWGCYEFMRKNSGKESNLKDNLRLFDEEWEKYLLVGNIHKSIKTYIIIDVLRYKKKGENEDDRI